MADKVTGVKTNGAITRETMASGKSTGVNHRPRLHSPAGIKVRAARRAATYQSKTRDRFSGGFHEPGSMNPRKVGR